MIPEALKGGIDSLLDSVSRHDLSTRSAAISAAYREQNGSVKAIRSHQDALAYLITRLPATYAAAIASLNQIKISMPDFVPISLLDAGAGTGSATWAATSIWNSFSNIDLLDENSYLLAAGKILAPHWQWHQGALQSSSLPKADLVIASYALGESKDSDIILDRLWQSTIGVLLIIEPGTPTGYANIRKWREQLLVDKATICAPCPHDLDCPIVSPDWCHFSTRLPRSRDHLLLKNAKAPFEDEKFSYFAATKLKVPNRAEARILTRPIITKPGISCKLCTHGRIEIITTPRRDPIAYKAMVKKNWGDSI